MGNLLDFIMGKVLPIIVLIILVTLVFMLVSDNIEMDQACVKKGFIESYKGEYCINSQHELISVEFKTINYWDLFSGYEVLIIKNVGDKE